MADEKDEQEGGFETLLQGKEAWWHFLEAKANGSVPEVPVAESGLELQEVGRMAERAERAEREQRSGFRLAPTQSLRCDRCQAQIPADLTFCVFCGASPRFMAAMRWQLLIIDRVEDPDVLEELSRILESANEKLTASELRHALSQPPAVFYFHGRDEHAAAFVARLSELGIRVHTSYAERPDVSMNQEIVESIARNPHMLRFWFALLIGAVVGAFFLPILLVMGITLAVSAAMIVFQARQYKERYELNMVQVLNALTGFDETMIQQAVHTLERLEDPQVKQLLTVCLTEYYAIWRQLGAASPEVRPLLSDLKENLDDLLIQILGSCAKYAELDSYARRVQPDKIRERHTSLCAQRERTSSPREQVMIQEQIAQLERQLHTHQEAERVLRPFRDRLELMMASMETLRGRVVGLTLRHEARADQEAQIAQILLDLDIELDTFEDVVEDVSVQSYVVDK